MSAKKKEEKPMATNQLAPSHTTQNGDEIYDDIPIPFRAERRTYPFDSLDVNQCFVVNCDSVKHERSIRSCATRYNNNEDGKRYIVRRLPETELTVGVWRIS